MEHLLSNQVIEAINIGGTVFHHIALPAKAVISERIVRYLMENYRTEEEIGGLVICEPQILDKSVCLHLNRIQLIKNVSEAPTKSYRPYKTQEQRKNYEEIIKSCFLQGLLPLRFHSHPVGINDIVQNRLNFIQQLETSQRDQVTSLIHRDIEQIKLRLPDILIVKEGDSMFIGLYGGLICPISFDKSKRTTISNTLDQIVDDISDWADSPKKKVGIAVCTFGLVFLALRYPKTVFPATLIGAATIIPTILEHQKYPEYFTITKGRATSIEIPKIDKVDMIRSEKTLNEIKISIS